MDEDIKFQAQTWYMEILLQSFTVRSKLSGVSSFGAESSQLVLSKLGKLRV